MLLNINVDIMKCKNCGFENKDEAKFCTKCGTSFTNQKVPENNVQGSNSTRYIIIALVMVIIVLVACVGYFAGVISSNDSVQSDDDSNQNATASQPVQSDEDLQDDDVQTTSVSSSKSSTSAVESKSWEPIGSYSGSGSGSQTIEVPDGEIMVKLSAYPIKNYADNHLYVTGDNGQSGGVDWGPQSDVETRSDSFSYTSSSSNIFTIDYYETVSWDVEFYRYQ